MTRIVLEKEVRRSQLVDAATEVFAQKGYRCASIADIIAAAGVARGTFYLYFDSKLAVFHAVMDRFFGLYKEVVVRELARPYDNPLKVRRRIRESLLEWLRFFNDNKDLAKVVLREATAIDPDYEKKCLDMLGQCFKHWREFIVKFQRIGLVRRDLDPDFLNMVFSGIMINVVLQYIIPNPKPDLEHIAAQWVEFIGSGIKTKGWLG